MVKHEAKFQSTFTRWQKDTPWPNQSSAFELKVSPHGRLPPSKVPEHQVVALLACASLQIDWRKAERPIIPRAGGFVYKISDSALGAKPFDCFMFQHSEAFLVVGFNNGRDVVAYPIKTYARKWLDGGTCILSEASQEGSRLRQDNKWVA